MKIKRIFLTKPNINNEYCSFENQLQTRIVFKNNKFKTLFEANKKNIMETVEREIKYYVNCDNLCNDKENMFPRRCILTGEWYLSEINFEYIDFLSIRTAFIGTDLGYRDDYLGLEVTFCYDENLKTFLLTGVNSESI
jgi:hypothetical protein